MDKFNNKKGPWEHKCNYLCKYLYFLCVNRNVFAFSAEVLDENNNIYTHEDDIFEGLKLKACVASMHQNTVRDLTNYSFIFSLLRLFDEKILRSYRIGT